MQAPLCGEHSHTTQYHRARAASSLWRSARFPQRQNGTHTATHASLTASGYSRGQTPPRRYERPQDLTPPLHRYLT